MGSIYEHHFFRCENHLKNRDYFRMYATRLYEKGKGISANEVPKGILNGILCTPCPMWVGLLDAGIFEHKLKLPVVHELHRILTMASILSWGRFYVLPEKYLFDGL